MIKSYLLIFLPFCLPTALSAGKLNLTQIGSTLYEVEKTIPIDSKKMMLSVSFCIIVSLFGELVADQIYKNFFFIGLLITASTINGIILYYSFKLKPLGWIAWLFKTIVVVLLFWCINCLGTLLFKGNWVLGKDDIQGAFFYALIFQWFLTYYLIYKNMVCYLSI